MPRQTKNSIRHDILNRHHLRSGKEALEQIGWDSMSQNVGTALESLLQGRNALRDAYRDHLERTAQAAKKFQMTFALDGRLVGDIGELIAAEMFCLELLGTKSTRVDAKTTRGPKRMVQIKATFKEHGLSIKHGADYFVGLQFNDEGQFRVVYNGPAAPVMHFLKAPKLAGHSGRAKAGSNLESLSLGTWAMLNLAVPENRRIQRRPATQPSPLAPVAAIQPSALSLQPSP